MDSKMVLDKIRGLNDDDSQAPEYMCAGIGAGFRN